MPTLATSQALAAGSPGRHMLLQRLQWPHQAHTAIRRPWQLGRRAASSSTDGGLLPAAAAAAAGWAKKGSNAAAPIVDAAAEPPRSGVFPAALPVDLQLHVPTGPSWHPDALPQRWLAFSDLHVSHRTRATCLAVLEQVHEEAARREAGILFLGDFWHTRGSLPVEPLNEVVALLAGWRQPTLMLPGNHDQVSLGGLVHALTPLAASNPAIHAFDGPALFLEALWLPYRRDRAALEAALAAATRAGAAAAATGEGGSGAGGRPRAVFAHTDIIGALMNDTYQAHDGLPPDLFPPDIPTYTGHYHKPHTVAGSRITYVGSPYQVTRAESGQQKRLLLLDRSGGWEVAEELPLDLGPRYFAAAALQAAPLVEPAADVDAAEVAAAEQLAPEFELQLPGGLRAGDRLLVTLPTAAAKQHQKALKKLELQGVEIEVFTPPQASAAPRISAADGEGPLQLWERYCAWQRLPPPVAEAGSGLLRALLSGGNGSGAGSLEQPHTAIEFRTVELEGYFSFREPVRYEVGDRGLVVVTGMVQDAAEAGVESNGAGKTALMMAPLWALTGSVDSRAEGSTTARPVLADLINDDCKRARVRVEGSVNGTPFVVERVANRKSSSVTFQLDGKDLTTQENRLTQERIDATLGAELLGRVVFYGQSDITALLEASDRGFKQELSKLVDLNVWARAKEASRAELSARREGQRDEATTLRERQQQAASLQQQLEGKQAAAQEWEQQQAAAAAGLRLEADELLAQLRGWQVGISQALGLGGQAAAELDAELVGVQRQLDQVREACSSPTELAAAEQRLAEQQQRQQALQEQQQQRLQDLGSASAEAKGAVRQQQAAEEQAAGAAAALGALLQQHPCLAAAACEGDAAGRAALDGEVAATAELNSLLERQKELQKAIHEAQEALTAARVAAAGQQSRLQGKQEAAERLQHAAAAALAAAQELQSELAVVMGATATTAAGGSLAGAKKQRKSVQRRLAGAQQRLGAAQGQAGERLQQLHEYLALSSGSSGDTGDADGHEHGDAAAASVCDRCLQPISQELFQQNAARLEAAAATAAAKAAKAEQQVAELQAAVADSEAAVTAAEQWEAQQADLAAANEAATAQASEAEAAAAEAAQAATRQGELDAVVAAAQRAVEQQAMAAEQLEAAIEAAEDATAVEQRRQQLAQEAAYATATQQAAGQRLQDVEWQHQEAAAQLQDLEAAVAEAAAAVAATRQQLQELGQWQQQAALLQGQEQHLQQRQRLLQSQVAGLEGLGGGQLVAAVQALQQLCGGSSSSSSSEQPSSSSSSSSPSSGGPDAQAVNAEAALEAVAGGTRAKLSAAEDLQQRWHWHMQQPNLPARDAALVAQQLAAAEEHIAEVERRHAELDAEVAVWKQVDDAFLSKGIVNFVVEGVLGDLQDATSRNLSALTSGMSLTLSPCKPAAKKKGVEEGGTIEQIEKVVHVRQPGSLETRQRNVRQLSGGERRRVALALALGFSELAAQRGRLRSNMIVLDEVMQHLDGEGCMRVAQLLKQLPGYSSIFVVAQAHSLWTQVFDSTDVVVKAGGHSRVEQQSSADVS